MIHTRAAVSANLTVIHQGIRLLDALEVSHYTQRLPLCFNSAIGGHMRHVIDHYTGFLAGLDGAGINYEKRQRDALVEGDPRHAAAVLESVATRLTAFADHAGEPSAILVYSETSPDGETCVGSSHIRELEFLLSHTIHHYALIAVMARMLGIEPEPTFGIAPSTMRYEQSRAAATPCAR